MADTLRKLLVYLTLFLLMVWVITGCSPQPTAVPPTPPTTTLLVTGDVLLARSVNYLAVTKYDITWPWQKTADALRAADITYINLETPLISNCPLKNDGMIFCGDPRHVEGLAFAGVDVINLANNHMGNYGQAGVDQTVQTLQNAGFVLSGLSQAGIIEKNGIKFAFLGYNEVDQQVGISPAEESLIRIQIAEARTTADVIIVQFHWGAEYTREPTTNQRRLGHVAIDSGADLVVGNHPHWWQSMETYNGKVIMYSHGNFIFDQMWSLETRQGLVGKYTFAGTDLTKVEFLPVQIEAYGQPRWLDGEEKEKILKQIRKISER